MALFVKECGSIGRSVVWFLFLCVAIVFYFMNCGFDIHNQIVQVDSEEPVEFNFPSKDVPIFQYYYEPSDNPLIPPSPAETEFGYVNAIIPERTMPNACAMLATEYLYAYGEAENPQGNYTHYSTLGFLKHTTLTRAGQKEIAQMLVDMTGLSPMEIGEAIGDLDGIVPFAVHANEDYGSRIPVKITYQEFKRNMRRVDQLIGGGSPYAEENLVLFAARPVTYEDKLAGYRSIVEEDKITNAYARYYCDYMGIVVALFGIFIPVYGLLRDKRAKMTEILFSRGIASWKITGIRYLASVVMLFLPIFLVSLIPQAELMAFAAGHGLQTDPLAFLKYEALWILPTVLTVTSVGFLLTWLTDTMIAVVVQIVWSYFTLIVTPFTGSGGITGTGLVMRFNRIGGRDLIEDHYDALMQNRLLYTLVAILIFIISIAVYDKKRRGRINIGERIRYAVANRNNTAAVELEE